MDVLEKPLQEQRVELDYTTLYENLFPVCARFVRSMNGNLNDAKDIFQDALVIFHEKYFKDDLQLTTSAEAYILGIARHLWLKKFKKNYPLISLTDFEMALTIPEGFYPTVNTRRLADFLERAGRQCLTLLSAFYYDKLTMKELSSAMGYRNEHSAAIQKYKCIEKLRLSVKQQSLSYEDFTE